MVEDGDGLIPFNLCEGSFSIPRVPSSCGIVGVIIGVNIRSLAPWVCCLGTPYVPRRGAWVDKFGCWGAASLAGPRGIVSWQILPTQEVFVRGGTLNRDRSPVNGTGGGRWASRCQIHADCWLSSFELGDDIVGGERGGSEVGSWDSSPSKESQLLQVSADFLCVYERED